MLSLAGRARTSTAGGRIGSVATGGVGMSKRGAWWVVAAMSTGCGDDVAGSVGTGTGTDSGSSGGASTSTTTGATDTATPTTGGPGTISEGMSTGTSEAVTLTGTGSSGEGSSTDGSSTGAGTSTGDGTGSETSDGSTSDGSTGDGTDSSTGEPLLCGDPVESMGAAVTFGGLGGEQPLGFGVGADGARYSGGVFFGPSVDLKPGGGAVFPAQGNSGNMWLNKVAVDGSYVYGYTWPTISGYHCYVWSFAPDTDGSVYVVGHFVGDLDLDPGPGVDKHKAGDGKGDLAGFMIKLGPDGKYQWGRHWGSDWTTAFSVVMAPDGALYVTGYFGGNIDLDPGVGSDPYMASGVGNATDGYLSKFDHDGNYLWGRTWGAGGEVYSYDVAVDADGNPVVSGTTGGPADLNPGPGMQVHNALGLADTFVERFLADGTWSWAFAVGGANYEQINDITVDPMGRVWIAGGFNSASIDLDPGVDMAVLVNMGQNYDGFVARYAADGKYEQSLALAGQGHDNLWGITTDCHGGVYVAGHFSQMIDLDPGVGVAMHSSGGESDPFLVALDDVGAYRWSRSWPNSGSGGAQGVAIDEDQMVHAQINFYGQIDADAGPGALNFASKGDQDVLLQRLRPSNGDW